MILHCDDGIQHVEAVLEESTNHNYSKPNGTPLTVAKSIYYYQSGRIL